MEFKKDIDNMVDLKLQFPDGFFEEEERNGFLVTEQIKQLWAVELDLLAEVDRVCKKHEIQYMACAGTMLGALRHKGFIPWDDDIDLMMTWENYKRFSQIGPEEFKEPYFFQTDRTYRGSTRGHIQIRNSNTTAILSEERQYKYQFNQGIFIDVFCLDHIPDSASEREVFFEEIKRARIRALKNSKRTYRYNKTVRLMNRGIKRIAKDLLFHVYRIAKAEEKAYDDYENTIHKYNSIQTKEMGLICIIKLGERYCWLKEDLESDLIYIPFEFMHIPVPSEYNRILTKTYGDWHEFIPGTSNHGDLFWDTDHSYRKYI